MAAGLALPADQLGNFRKGLGKAIEEQLGKVVREEPTLQIDAWLGLDEIDLEFAESLEALAPFGAGNQSLDNGNSPSEFAIRCDDWQGKRTFAAQRGR